MTIQEKEKLFNKIMEMLSPIVFNKLMNIFESKVQSAEEGFSFKDKNTVITDNLLMYTINRKR